MENIEKRLAAHPFLRGVSADNIRLLAEDTVPMSFKKGEFLFKRGRKAPYLFLVEKGSVVVGLLQDRKGPVGITRLGKGGILGWSWAFAPYRWRFDARAETKVTALALEGKPVLAKMGRYPLLGYELMSHLALSLSQGLEATRHKLVEIHHKPAGKEYVLFPQPMF